MQIGSDLNSRSISVMTRQIGSGSGSDTTWQVGSGSEINSLGSATMLKIINNILILGKKNNFLLVPLHSSLSSEEQNLVFSNPKVHTSTYPYPYSASTLWYGTVVVIINM